MESSYGGTDYFEELGQTRKEGLLKKKSPVLGLWKERYVVLDGPSLTYYKTYKHFTDGDPGKVMNLSPASMTSFTPVENCFTIRQNDSLSMGVGAPKASSKIRRTSLASTKAVNTEPTPSGEDSQWFLLASDENELYDWITAISAHIHLVHMQKISYPSTLNDRMASGESNNTFYEAPLATSPGEHKLPIGLRTIPERTGPRTGDAIYPGEVFEVIHRFEADGNGYLRLAGNRGWLFELHPATGEPLVVLAESGHFDPANRKFQYAPSDTADSIPMRCGPCLEARATGEVLDASDSIFSVTGTWTPADVEGTSGQAEFLKLAGTQSWIPHLSSLKEILETAPIVSPAAASAKKGYRRASINMAMRTVDFRTGGSNKLASNKDVMVSRRKSNITLEEAAEIL